MLVSNSLLSLLLSTIGINLVPSQLSWFKSSLGFLNFLTLFLFLINFSFHIIQDSATYTDYIEVIRTITSICAMIIIFLERKAWNELHACLNEEFNRYIGTSTRKKFSTQCRCVSVIAMILILTNFIVSMFIDLPLNCSNFLLPMPFEVLNDLVCFPAIITLTVIVHGVTIYSGAFYVYMIFGFDSVYDEFSEYCRKRLEHSSTNNLQSSIQMNQKVISLHEIRMEYRQICRLRRNFEKSLSLFPFIWLTGYFLQTNLCLLRASFDFGPIWHRLFYNWTLFAIMSFFLVLITLVADRSMRKSFRLNELLIGGLISSKEIPAASISIGMDEILFHEDLLRISHIPITIFGLAELRLATIPIFINIVTPLVVMGYQEIRELPGIRQDSK